MSKKNNLIDSSNSSIINEHINGSVTDKQKNSSHSFIQTYQKHITGFIICSLSVLNVTDRFVVSSVLIDVQKYFGVDKSTAGLLQTAFLLCYMALSPLNGYLGDRINRKYLLVFSLVLWISSTLAGSYIPADKFYLFVLCRCLFGVATASFETIAVPIIGDRFANNPKLKNTVILIFCMGPPIGVGLSYLIGIISKDIEPTDWRFSMRITPCILLFILLIIIFGYIEPRHRIETETEINMTSDKTEKTTFIDDLKILLKNKTYILLSLCWILGIGGVSGFSWWSPTLIDYSLRFQQLPINIDNFKKIYSLVQSLGGVAGILISFKLSILLKKKSYATADCYLLSFGFFGSCFLIFLYLATIDINVYFTLLVYLIMFILFNFCWVLETNIFLDIIQPKLRSTGNSMMIFSLHLLGDSSTPYWIGLIADKCLIFKNNDTIFSSLYCTQISNYPLVFVFFFAGTFALFTSLTFKKDKKPPN